MIVDMLKPLAVPIDSVHPDPRNARVHPERNLEALRRSLQYYGQRKPIVVRREDRRIIAGNGLWLAAKDLGWTEIAAVFVEDDEITATGYALMDNQSALLADWDFEVLGELMEELRANDFDLDLTGFEAPELDFPKPVVIEDADIEEAVDRREELQRKWGTNRGQIWEIPSTTVPGCAHRVMCGDSGSLQDLHALVGESKVSMIFADPPYGMNFSILVSIFDVIANCFKDVVSFWMGSDKQVVMLANHATNFTHFFVHDFVMATLISNQQPMQQHNLIAKFGNRPSNNLHDSFSTIIKVPTLRTTSQHKIFSQMKRPELPLALIVHYSDPGSIILDPFLGAGSTLIAAEAAGRLCLGMEIDPTTLAVALEVFSGNNLEPKEVSWE